MLSANVIEHGGLYLTNLVKNGSSITNSNRVYGISFNYSQWLIPDHTYYYSFTYKYSDPANSSQAPNRVALFYADGMGLAYVGTDLGGSDGWFTVSGTTEKQYLGLFTPTTMWAYAAQGSWGYGSVYHKYVNGSTIVTEKIAKMQLREVVVTDVTILYKFYKGQGKTDKEIISALNSYGDLAEKFYAASGVKECVPFPIELECSQKSWFKKSYAYIPIDLIECDGMTAYSVGSLGKDCYFDLSDKLSIYDNAGSGAVTKKRVIDTSSPFYPKRLYVVLVKTSITSKSPSPGLGGILNNVTPDYSDTIVEKLVAKVPIGYSILCANNSLCGGTKTPDSYLGTGKYEEYTFVYKIGSTTTTSARNIGHIYIAANSNAPDTKNVTWYIAYINYCKLTNTNITDWCAMPGTIKTNSYYVYTSEIDSLNLFLNGDGSDTNMPLPSKYLWLRGDLGYDLEGWNAIMLPSTTSTSLSEEIVGPKMPINPLSRYKLTCRIWADGAKISSFLMALPYYRTLEDSSLLRVYNILYKPGTNTVLDADAAAGAKTIIVKDASNWLTDRSWSGVGFRSSVYKSYFDKGVLTEKAGTVSTINGNTLTLRTGLAEKHLKNERIYLAQNTSNFYYPINKDMLPTKEWKKFEIYFGKPDEMWDGRGESWVDIPWDARYMGLIPNLYANNSGSPIIFDNIRIEEVYTPAEKKDLKVQIKKFGKRFGNIYSANTTLYNVKLASNLKSGFTVTANNYTLTKTTDVAKFRAELIVTLACTGSQRVTESGVLYDYTFDKFSSPDEKISKQLYFVSVENDPLYYELIQTLSAGVYTFTVSNYSESLEGTDPFNGFCAIAYDTSWSDFSSDNGIHNAYTAGKIVEVFDLYLGSSSKPSTFHTFNKSVNIVVYNCVYDYLNSWYKVAGTDSDIKYSITNVDYSLDLVISQASGVTITNNQFSMPEHDVVLDVVYKKTAVPKYTLTINPPAYLNNDRVRTDWDYVKINGTSYRITEASSFSFYAGQTVTLGYEPYDAYNYGSETFTNIFLSWKPTGFTISNNSFTMPAKNCSLTWTYTYVLWYTVTVGSNNVNCSPKLGLKEGSYTETSLKVKPGTIVWYNLNPDASSTTYRATFTGGVSDSNNAAGYFTMPSSNVVLTGTANKNTYYTLKLSNPGDYTLKADNVTVTSTGIKILSGKRVYLGFTPGYTTVSSTQRTKNTLGSYSSSLITFDGNYFYMPEKDATITVNLTKTSEYLVLVGTFTGGTISVSTSFTKYYSTAWAASGTTVGWKVTFSNENNACNVKAIKTGTTTQYTKWDKNDGAGTFSMPSYPVTLLGDAWEAYLTCPFNGLMVYSILNSSASRAMWPGNQVSRNPDAFLGFGDTLNNTELPQTGPNLSDLPTVNYLDIDDQMPDGVLMADNYILIYCAFAVSRESASKTITIRPCSDYNADFNLVSVQTGRTLLLVYNENSTTISDSINGLYANFTKVKMAEGIDAYLGWITCLYRDYENLGICQRLNIDILDVKIYSIDFSYSIPGTGYPAFYPGYTPLASSTSLTSSLLQAPLNDYVQASSWDSAVNLVLVDPNDNNIIDILLWQNFASNAIINIGFGSSLLTSDGHVNPNARIERATGLNSYRGLVTTYRDCFSIINNSILRIDLEKCAAEEIILSDDIASIVNGSCDCGLFVSVGCFGTLYTFVTSPCLENITDMDKWIHNSAQTNTWITTDIAIIDEDESKLDSGDLLEIG